MVKLIHAPIINGRTHKRKGVILAIYILFCKISKTSLEGEAVSADQLRLYGAGISDDEDGSIEFDYDADGQPVWELGRNMDADGVTIARMLGGVVPHPLNIGEYYRIPIRIPHDQPLAGIAYAQERLASRNKFTEPSLYYMSADDDSVEVVVDIQSDGLLVRCCRMAVDDKLAEKIDVAVTQELGACTIALWGNHGVLVTLGLRPAPDDYDGLLATCHRLAEIVYAAVH